MRISEPEHEECAKCLQIIFGEKFEYISTEIPSIESLR